MKILAVLPFRLQSSRIPEKIFHKIAGEELCVRTLKQTLKTKFSNLTVIAAVDDERTQKLLSEHIPENQVILTDPNLPSGTDRVFMATKIFAAANNMRLQDLHSIVNVQGDMPFLSPLAFEKFLLQVISHDPNVECIFTPYEAWPAGLDPHDLGNVKIATDTSDRALYFSRFPIPCSRVQGDENYQKFLKMHVGIYAYTPTALEKFCRSEISQLEKLESLEQLRALSLGIPIKCVKVEGNSTESFRGIDIPSDLEWAEKFYAQSAPVKGSKA